MPYGRHFDQQRLIGSLCLNADGDGLAITEKGKTAAEALAYLKDRGVTVRGLGGYKMPNHLRISVGTVAGNDAALKLLKDFLGK